MVFLIALTRLVPESRLGADAARMIRKANFEEVRRPDWPDRDHPLHQNLHAALNKAALA